jgi:hypothetical protein
MTEPPEFPAPAARICEPPHECKMLPLGVPGGRLFFGPPSATNRVAALTAATAHCVAFDGTKMGCRLPDLGIVTPSGGTARRQQDVALPLASSNFKR